MDHEEALKLPRYLCRVDYHGDEVALSDKRYEGQLVRIIGSTQKGVPEFALIKIEFVDAPYKTRLISPSYLVKDEQDQQKLV